MPEPEINNENTEGNTEGNTQVNSEDILAQLAKNGHNFKSVDEVVKSFTEKESTIDVLKENTAKVLQQNEESQKQISTLIEAISKQGTENLNQGFNETREENQNNQETNQNQTVGVTEEMLDELMQKREQKKIEAANQLKQQTAQKLTQAFGNNAQALLDKYGTAIKDMSVDSAIAFIKGASLNSASTGDFRTEREDNSTTSEFGKITAASDKELRRTNPQVANSIAYITALSKVPDEEFYKTS